MARACRRLDDGEPARIRGIARDLTIVRGARSGEGLLTKVASVHLAVASLLRHPGCAEPGRAHPAVPRPRVAPTPGDDGWRTVICVRWTASVAIQKLGSIA